VAGPVALLVALALQHPVQLPAESFDYVSWDPVLKQTPNRSWRRWGTRKLVDTTEIVLREYRDAHPDAPRVLVGDLSRRQGGFFGRRYGGLGHLSHRNGLDVDIYYPRKDGLERAARRPEQVDREAAQELVDRFVAFGAIKVYVGPRVHLSGRRGVVIPLVYHDDHLHVRLSPRRVNRPVAG
jgi:murein endopeptidase